MKKSLATDAAIIRSSTVSPGFTVMTSGLSMVRLFANSASYFTSIFAGAAFTMARTSRDFFSSHCCVNTGGNVSAGAAAAPFMFMPPIPSAGFAAPFIFMPPIPSAGFAAPFMFISTMSIAGALRSCFKISAGGVNVKSDSVTINCLSALARS